MPTLSVTPLANGITPAGTALTGMLALAGLTTNYLYWDDAGNVYWQADAATPASSTPIFSAGFAITCVDFFFSGSLATTSSMGFVVFLGGSGGNYAFGTIDDTGASTLTAFTHSTTNFSAAAFNPVDQAFIVGTTTGTLFKVDCTLDIVTNLVPDNPTITTVLALPTGLGAGITLYVRSIKYDPTYLTANCLIVCTASTNTDPRDATLDGTTGIAMYTSASNISVLFYGAITSLSSYSLTGINLWLGCFGYVESTPPTKVINLIAIGEDMRVAYSSTGASWSLAPVDPNILGNQTLALTFNTWVYVASVPGGYVLLSTDGKNWEFAVDPLLFGDPLSPTPVPDIISLANA